MEFPNLTFFRRFLTHPGQVGAVCPSSPELGRMMVADVGLETAQCVVELGPGTGAITREIIAAMAPYPEKRFLAVELDESLCDGLRRDFPTLELFNDSASNLPEILRSADLKTAELVLSGLPWAIFPESLQREILTAVWESLSPGGYFATFAYVQGVWLPAGRKFRELLWETFGKVELSPIVWRNFPPAFVYRCRTNGDSGC